MLDFYTFNHFKNNPSLLHAVTTKSHTLPYSFSLALHTGENKTDIISNRKRLSEYFQSDSKFHFIVANQTHSDHIAVITENVTKGWADSQNAIEDCDALITNKTGVILTILTADCVPILLFDPVQNVVGAVHAGWKGTKAHIVKKTIQRMKSTFGCDAKDIVAGIAPSIGACCYEVGYDVAQHFLDYPKSMTKKEDKYMLNLPYINHQQLLQSGLDEKNIEMSNICTACEVTRYFSYRKEQGCSGRFMSMIGLKEIL